MFLPQDAVRPSADWLRPTSADVREGKERGRTPGVSLWDRELASVEQACNLSGKRGGEAFGMTVARSIEIGRQHDRELAVVYDPLDEHEPTPGWQGHALLEGLHWPGKAQKRARKALREALVAEVVPVD